MVDKIKILEELKRYYSVELAEDKQDGTSFDCKVLDAIDGILADEQIIENKQEK